MSRRAVGFTGPRYGLHGSFRSKAWNFRLLEFRIPASGLDVWIPWLTGTFSCGVPGREGLFASDVYQGPT